MSRSRTLGLGIVWLSGALAAPVVEKVEPPNWWLKHTWRPVQVLLTGKGLAGASVVTQARGIQAKIRYASANGRYLFVYLDLGAGARPGRHRFRVQGPAGAGEFFFTLDPPLEPRRDYRGFTPDDVLYLLMPDRFANGDPANDSPPEYDHPADRGVPNAYHGGDFRGIRQHLDYLRELGVSGIWLNPVYKNSVRGGSSYHGYSTVDFYDAEPRFGGMSEFRELVAEAHRMGIKIMQDQVANHCGPLHPWVNDPPTRTWFHDLGLTPKIRNNFDIAGLADPYARPSRRYLPLNGWFAAILPDFNQDDPLASDYLIQNALWWIGRTGIDGIRQDTYPYVDRPFWEKWQTAIDRQFPGFFVVGEITARTPAVLSFFEGGTRRYGVDTKLPSLFDFPFERAMRNVFAKGAPMTELAEILAQDSLYRHPQSLVTFFGNHDQPRFLTLAGREIGRLKMAQAFLLTTRGIPHLYYGDEIALAGDTEQRDRSVRADFPGGFPGDPADAFQPNGRTGSAREVFGWLQDLLTFRRQRRALRAGKLVQLVVEKDRYAYLRSTGEEHVLVLLNRSGREPMELELADLGIPDGSTFQAWPAGAGDARVTGGKLRLEQPKDVNLFWARAGLSP